MKLYDKGTAARPFRAATRVLVSVTLLTIPLAAGAQIRFEEVPGTGVDFVHTSGRSEYRYVPEQMGGGAVWLDFDADGHWDLYLVDSGTLPGIEPLEPAPPEAGTNRIFRGLPGRAFEPVPGSSLEDRGYGMGVAAGDYDNDGWVDVYVSNFGDDALFRNNGDGTFEDVTDLLPPDAGWGTSIAWGDLDEDGWIDLFVTHYTQYDLDSVPLCSHPKMGFRVYCPPLRLDGDADRLLHNLDGTGFRDVSAAAGVENPLDGKGLAVVISDLTGDGLADIYVANDTTQNFMYVNQGDMTFVDEGLVSGAGLSDFGQPQSGMGVAIGDVDGNGSYEIAVTNFVLEPVNIYSRGPGGLYLDSSYVWGVGEPTLNTVGFGVSFMDADGDGDLDLFVANGHVLDDQPYWAQPNQALRNERIGPDGENPTGSGAHFTEITKSAGEVFSSLEISRGLAVADADHDGRPDLVITNNNGPARVAWNLGDPAPGRLVLRLRGMDSNRDALGTEVRLLDPTGEHPEIERRSTVLAGSSYLSQDATDLYFGLGTAPEVSLEITWPDGTTETLHDVEPDQLLYVRQGVGMVAGRPLDPR